MKEIVNCAAYAGGHRVADVELNGIREILKDNNKFVWIGLYEPSEELLSRVQDEFGLHDLAVEDAHRAHQRPKIELYGDSLFIVLRTVQMARDCNIQFGETHFFVGTNFIVVVRHGSSVAYTDVRHRCETMPDLLSKGQGFVLYAIMDFIVDMYFPVVQELELALETIEDKVFKENPSRETTEQIYQLKKQLLDVKRAVSPLIDICNRLMRFDIKYISPETQPYFRDIYDHALRINEMVDNTRELLNTALDANFSLISISQNDTSRKFAGWAAIIAVPTMVAGFYGMNFKFMPELEWTYGYPLVVLFTICVCVIVYYFFRRSGWL
ncbi:magnesium/cobalt transporter CorA [Longitalea luteola]|uniref:magnesium/cobalt transporter CorA n=1 Tax=Longitalea luteola TaxID=2812563 RepID=UPI001A96937B|nr:magnesium/cobalt transporter CorA [Longitalea luteola]